ncbi:MAG: basic amino acid/polyamine antiporter, family [Gammaproteobacteria bacterium]|jgi:APA family basic amino acid/polyamine antiporter|nr:basic amino acid/polyamine antiporter, family [Gammaproteobacteria bacterium]
MNWRIKPLDAILATAEKRSLSRTLGGFQLMMLGVGAIIGTGIFVLTAEAAQKAGPGMLASFVIAGFVCAVTALCYAELASMVPVSGSAYTYSYAVLGELIAWIVGWALILEYTVAASAVSVGWSNYFVPLVQHSFNLHIPIYLTKGYFAGGLINVPAVVIASLVTGLLVLGTRESATVNAVLVCIKVAALCLFIALSVPVVKMANFHPFAPLGVLGVGGAAASIFFAYVGFDAVSTAAEETRNPQRNMPIGLIGSLLICTVFYLLVAGGAIGSIGAQPVMDAAGHGLDPGSAELLQACMDPAKAATLVCSDEPLAHVLRQIGWDKVSRLIGLAAFLALPSVILMMMFGQTRIFFSMARDRLLPDVLTRIHTRFHTPHVVTMITGAVVISAAAFFPVGKLADLSNGGTLTAFFAVALGVMVLRLTNAARHRPFRTPFIWVVGPLALVGCVILFLLLPLFTILVFFGWALLGLIVYGLYGYRRSVVAEENAAALRP